MIYLNYMKKPIIFSVLAVVFLGGAVLFWRMRATVSNGFEYGGTSGMYTESSGTKVTPSEYIKPDEMMPDVFPEPGTDMIADKMMGNSSSYYPEIYPSYPNYEQSASYSIVASDPGVFSRNLRNFATSVGASVTNSSLSKSGRYTVSYATLIVPTAKLSEVTDRITQEKGEIVGEDTYFNDRSGVLEQALFVVDELKLQKALKETEIAQASSSTEKLQLQVALAKIDRQLLQADRNVKIAQAETEQVSLNISVSTNKHYFSGEYSSSPKDQFDQAWYSFTRFFGGILSGFIWIAVYSLLIIPAGLFAWMAVRSWRAAKKS
jgi:hypothetical protein